MFSANKDSGKKITQVEDPSVKEEVAVVVEESKVVAEEKKDDVEALEVNIEEEKLDLPQKIQVLFKSNMKILTADGEFLQRPAEQQEIMALYENGVLLVSKSHVSDPYVLKLESYAKLRDIKITEKIPVSIDVIRNAYKHFNINSTANNSGVPTNLTKMQKDIVDLIKKAVEKEASDIHVMCSNVSAIVEMRKNGVLREEIEWQVNYGQDFCAACFAMSDTSDSNYNPTEYQAAQITSSTINLPMEVQALRLQFNPLATGRYMVMRLLYNSKETDKTQGVAHLGYDKYQTDLIDKMSKKPVGICIVSGPTGSGKSTTLFHILNKVMEDCNHERNVLTVEDPPERPIEGAKQMPVTNALTQEERGAKFTQAITAAMRSDPDTIMIGEIRDESSAGLAIEAAMTGHQVWTTLHANDAIMILNRLRDIGVPEFNLYTSGLIFGLIAQRLARTLCPKCRIPYAEAVKKELVNEKMQARITKTLGDKAKDLFIVGEGCTDCGDGKGYIGRTVVAEIIYPDEKFFDFMRNDKLLEAKEYWIKELKGMTMMVHSLLKALTGEISPAEIERVVGAIELEEGISLEDFK